MGRLESQDPSPQQPPPPGRHIPLPHSHTMNVESRISVEVGGGGRERERRGGCFALTPVARFVQTSRGKGGRAVPCASLAKNQGRCPLIGQEPHEPARGCEAPSSVSACCDCGDSPRAVRGACAVMTIWEIGSAMAHVYYERILFCFFKSAAT